MNLIDKLNANLGKTPEEIVKALKPTSVFEVYADNFQVYAMGDIHIQQLMTQTIQVGRYHEWTNLPTFIPPSEPQPERNRGDDIGPDIYTDLVGGFGEEYISSFGRTASNMASARTQRNLRSR